MNKLRQYRKDENITQKRFAEMVGVSQSDISDFERGRAPTLPVALKIKAVTAGFVVPDDFCVGSV